uniref:Variant surface glycoprotein (VSG), putative n=1 Tax=Trypanosoma brucei brucei (strain 927/4 GUTat10.1) TaxID=185431 RepID=Q4FKA1_TRYB2|nr:variant surface glycoprotein (VSG), putative [Trypanosoma brucei brucei TREU927]
MLSDTAPVTAASVLLVFVLQPKAEAAPGEELENAPAFFALCNVIRQCQRGFTAQAVELAEAAEAAYNSILAAEHLASTNNSYVLEKILAQENGLRKDLKPLPVTPFGITARKLINDTAAKAKETKNALDAAAKAAKDEAAAANKLLAAAITGDGELRDDQDDGSGYFTAATASKMFGTGASQNENCGGSGGNGNNLGISIINDLFCICVRGTTGNKKVCHATATAKASGAHDFTNSGNNNKNAYAALMAQCPKTLRTVTPASLEAAIAGYNNQIGTLVHTVSGSHEDAGYIVGYAHTGSKRCEGTNSQVCINYKKLLDKKDAAAIPWQVKIGQAIEKRPSSAVVQEIKAGTQTLAHMNLTVWQIYYSALSHTETQGDHSPKLLDSKKFEECKEHKPKKTCKEKGCKWEEKNETDGTCKPKAATENTAGAGEGAAGEQKKEEKCKGKLEPECTKAPECKWEGRACKDFSLYLIKQFALISSVFISLLGVLAFLRIFPQIYEIYELMKIWYFDTI